MDEEEFKSTVLSTWYGTHLNEKGIKSLVGGKPSIKDTPSAADTSKEWDRLAQAFKRLS